MILNSATHAKINLALHITGQRGDGYHFLESIVAFADIGDRLIVASDDALTLSITGPFSNGLEAENNLVMKVARALRRIVGETPGARLTLEKHLPVASGVGGGSGDAAAALQLLNRLWHLRMSPGQLAEVALALGADIPVCLESQSCLMKGIGEEITPVSLPNWGVVLVNSGEALDTASVFRAYDNQGLDPNESLAVIPGKSGDWISFLKRNGNALEAAAISLQPHIQSILDTIAATRSCLLSRMSGSGATCFGLYPDAIEAELAAESLKSEFPHFWVMPSTLR